MVTSISNPPASTDGTTVNTNSAGQIQRFHQSFTTRTGKTGVFALVKEFTVSLLNTDMVQIVTAVSGTPVGGQLSYRFYDGVTETDVYDSQATITGPASSWFTAVSSNGGAAIQSSGIEIRAAAAAPETGGGNTYGIVMANQTKIRVYAKTTSGTINVDAIALTISKGTAA